MVFDMNLNFNFIVRNERAKKIANLFGQRVAWKTCALNQFHIVNLYVEMNVWHAPAFQK